MQSAPSAKAPARVLYLDLLRVFAAFGIIMLHLAPLSEADSVVTALPWQTLTVLKAPFRACVPLFLMISGALFLSPDRPLDVRKLYGKTLLRILVSFVVWSAFYAAVHCLLMGKGKWTFLNQLLRGHYHMWFLMTIASLYMLTPILRPVTASREVMRYALALGLLFLFLIPQVNALLSLPSLPHADVFASARYFLSQLSPLGGALMPFYFVLGYALHTAPLRRGAWRVLLPLAAASLFAAVFATLRLSALQDAPNYQYLDTPALPVMVMSACLFLLARQACEAHPPSEKTARILGRLSRWSLGVYLLHPFLVERFQVALPASPLALILLLPLEALVFYALSLALSALIGRIPVLGRWIV